MDERQKRAEQFLVDAEMAQADRKRAEASLADMDRQTAEMMQVARVAVSGAATDYARALFRAAEALLHVLAGHAIAFASVAEGTLEIQSENGEWRVAAISGGFAEVRGALVELFVDTVEWGGDIDTVRAAEALRRAEERLKSSLSRVEYLRTQTAVAELSPD